MKDNEIMTRFEVAEMIGFKPDTVRKWGNVGRIPSHKVGGKVVFLKSEILKWIKKLPNRNINLKGGFENEKTVE